MSATNESAVPSHIPEVTLEEPQVEPAVIEPPQHDLVDLEPQPSLEKIIRSIASGHLDDKFSKLTNAMDDRRKARQDEVMRQVREVFGEDATVQVQSEIPKAMSNLSNPFVKHALEHSPDEVVDEEELSDEPTPDPLENLEVNNELERQMITDGTAGQVPMENRGAVISGLSASDIAE